MPIGLRNAAQTFQRFIDEVLRGRYFVASISVMRTSTTCSSPASPEEHLQHLRLVLERLEEHGIVINASKSLFSVSELDFLVIMLTLLAYNLWRKKST